MYSGTFAGSRSSVSGGVLCRPLSAPAQESERKWGVSDPARASLRRPRGRSAGSLTPHMSVSVMCWGARLMAAESALWWRCSIRENSARTSADSCPQPGRIPAQKFHPIDVAPVLDFPGALGRVKASFADAHRLRGLDPPGALPSVCNYRSDGRISNGDSV